MTENKYFTDGHIVDDDFKSIADSLYEIDFENSSWFRETRPSFSRGEKVVYVDRLSQQDRYWDKLDRFTIVDYRAGEAYIVFSSNLLSEVLSFLKEGKNVDS